MNRFSGNTCSWTRPLGAWLLLAALATCCASAADPNDAPLAPEARTWVAQLGVDDYVEREEATRGLISLGPGHAASLEAAMAAADDPEVRRRLRYVLEHITPPEVGVIVLRAGDGSEVAVGDLITHLDGRPIDSQDAWWQHFRAADGECALRLYTPAGPREAHTREMFDVQAVGEYSLPHGPAVQSILRDYARGLAERAVATLDATTVDIPHVALPRQLRAQMLFNVGRRAAALKWLDAPSDADMVMPARLGFAGNAWDLPSYLDLVGPDRAPYQLEWLMWDRRGDTGEDRGDPDLRVQRVLVPARRYVRALTRAAELWNTQFSQYIDPNAPQVGRFQRLGEETQAGNMLAVISWMCHELELRSECHRLIEPRSVVLRQPASGVNKWLRVDTDAWLALLEGDAKAALDQFYPDAEQILTEPLKPTDNAVLTQNPDVAARVAFFLYQFPGDPRVGELLSVVNNPEQSGLTEYAWWMCLAAREQNHDTIRRHLGELLANLPAAALPRFARALALLEYVQPQPQAETFAAVLDLMPNVADAASRAMLTAEIETLAALAAGNVDAAQTQLADATAALGHDVLRDTIDFLQRYPQASEIGVLMRPILAVPADVQADSWLVITRDRRLVRYAPADGQLIALPPPSQSWFPGPLTWPWIGRHADSGDVWLYDRRRIVTVDDSPRPLRVNIKTEQIGDFDRLVRPVWPEFVACVRRHVPTPGARGAFFAEDIRAYEEYVGDPNAAEIGWLAPVRGDGRIVHLALRGGPHLLIDPNAAQAWSSVWLAQQLELRRAPTLIARGVPERPQPLLYLTTDQGLVRFEPSSATVRRVPLPGDAPHGPLIPETLPYERRDPRFVYVARPPADGGALYRVHTETNEVEALETTNLALPAEYFPIRNRSAIRSEINRALALVKLPPLPQLIADITARVDAWDPGR